MRALRASLLTFLALAAASPVRARGGDDAPPPIVDLEYGVVTTSESVGENVQHKIPLVPRAETTLHAVLGPRRVDLAEGKTRSVLDHAHERVLRVLEDGSFRESSLLAHFAFLDMEMRNRATLAKTLAGAGMKDPSMRPRELSTLFGWRAQGDDTKVAASKDGDATVFRDGEEELARWTPSAEALDDAQRASLARFLHHRCCLHPAARDAIVAEGRAPASLRCRWQNTGARFTMEITLLGAKRVREDALLPLGRRVFDDADPLARVAKRVLDPSKEDAAARLAKDDFVRLAREAHKAGRYEDAALLLIECGLQTGDGVTEELRALRTDEATRERLEKLFALIAGKDLDRAIEGLAALDRTQFSRPHVLDVFRANDLAAKGKVEQARDTMLGALAQAPWLTGAWKDVGDMYYSRFDTEHTWLAWEAGRVACPGHGMWSQVAKFEAYLREKYRELL